MGAPFLTIEDFTSEYQGSLSDGEETTAGRLLQVVSDGIRARKPDVDPAAAAMVVFEVVRDAVAYGHLGPLTSFTNITAHRQESGTFDGAARAGDDYLTARHKRLLGIPVASNAAPRGSFAAGDY
ncbi:MAG TPA: hypothetical protein PLF91_00180 [Mycolicibacterium fallax]|nr:hypothetical protein [Mycolicibacterium fallax]